MCGNNEITKKTQIAVPRAWYDKRQDHYVISSSSGNVVNPSKHSSPSAHTHNTRRSDDNIQQALTEYPPPPQRTPSLPFRGDASYLEGEQKALKTPLDFTPRSVLRDPFSQRNPLEVLQIHLHRTEISQNHQSINQSISISVTTTTTSSSTMRHPAYAQK